MSAEVTATLIGARRLLAEVGWTQGAFARNAAGNVLSDSCGFAGAYDVAGVLREVAACYCAEGAIAAAAPTLLAAYAAVAVVRRAAGACCLHRWNDARGRTREEVLEAFDRAIALAGGQP